MALTCI
ncbi:hypothetical protein RDI58_019865 [Solanum bulbocastanum]